jgi:hypothetical protein
MAARGGRASDADEEKAASAIECANGPESLIIPRSAGPAGLATAAIVSAGSRETAIVVPPRF